MALTRKQEAFANSIVAGLSLAEAYRTHYATKNPYSNSTYVTACKLAKLPKVALRVAELQQAKLADQRDTEAFTVAVSRQKLLDVYELALSRHHYGSAVSALVECNKISGFHVQKLEVTGSVTHKDERLTEFSVEELRAFVMSKRNASLPEPAIEAEFHDVSATEEHAAE